MDSVAYSDRDPWPTTTDGTGPSLELIDPTLDNNDPVNWAASTALSGSTRGRPTPWRHRPAAARLRGLGHADRPAVSQPVTVTATSRADERVVRYQIDFTGEQTVAMTPWAVALTRRRSPGRPPGT